MSVQLLRLAQTFVHNKTDPTTFVENFITDWKRERDTQEIFQDSPTLISALSNIYILLAFFNPGPYKEDYEFSEHQLRDEIDRQIKFMSDWPQNISNEFDRNPFSKTPG